MKNLLILIVFTLALTPLFSVNNNVAIVYNGGSAVNRETAKYIMKQSSDVGLNFDYKILKVNAVDKIGEYGSVIILNTGIKDNGIDPVLKTFIDKVSNKNNLILLTFNKGGDSFQATLLTGEMALHGVDGVSSASIYKNGQNNEFKWFDMLVELLNGIS